MLRTLRPRLKLNLLILIWLMAITLVAVVKHQIVLVQNSVKELETPEPLHEVSTEATAPTKEARKGPGENGHSLKLLDLTSDEKEVIKKSAMNVFVSDVISLDRSIPDNRLSNCNYKTYPDSFEPVSIVIVFKDEHLSVMLRTVHSIVNRTPLKLLREIILVDDASENEDLIKGLRSHLDDFYPRYNLVHLKSRMGLIRGRMEGIKRAKSDLIVLLDSHVEVNVEWLPPLMAPILENYRTFTQPAVGVIESDTFKIYNEPETGNRGGFDWKLTYRELKLPKRPDMSENFEVPVLVGGLMAMNKSYFWELGGYDSKLEIWGGEQFELSFKTWMCGGRAISVPCSVVNHNYKSIGTHPFYKTSEKYIQRNLKRVAETWMDEYKEFYYIADGVDRSLDVGSLQKVKQNRQRLGCKSFKWYLKRLLPDIPDPILPDDRRASGFIQNVGKPSKCVDAGENERNHKLIVFNCDENEKEPNEQQNFIFLQDGRIRGRFNGLCLGFQESESKEYKTVVFRNCQNEELTKVFSYSKKTEQIRETSEGLCLDLIPKSKDLVMRECRSDSDTQRWKWGALHNSVYLPDLVLVDQKDDSEYY